MNKAHTVQTLLDPYSTEESDSAAHSRMYSTQLTAKPTQGRLELAATELIAEMRGLSNEMHRLVEKPLGPNVRTEVIIQRAYNEMTYPEIEKMVKKY